MDKINNIKILLSLKIQLTKIIEFTKKDLKNFKTFTTEININNYIKEKYNINENKLTLEYFTTKKHIFYIKENSSIYDLEINDLLEILYKENFREIKIPEDMTIESKSHFIKTISENVEETIPLDNIIYIKSACKSIQYLYGSKVLKSKKIKKLNILLYK